jgi:hypothetical protein
MQKLKYTLLVWLLCFGVAQAQEGRLQQDLPFFIDPSKRMPEFEIEDKKEGTFITGVPRFQFDPIRGFGIGGNVFLLINKDKNDPFFEYTPYRHRVSAEFFIFQNGRVRYALNYDAPYIFNTKWRMRADAVLWEDPEAQYWGIGRSSLQPLQFTDKATGQRRIFSNVNEYEANLDVATPLGDGRFTTDRHFNHMVQREQLYNLLLERTFMGGKMRTMFGYEALFTAFESYGGQIIEDDLTDVDGNSVAQATHNPTLVDLQKAAGVWNRFNLAGFEENYQFTSMLAAAFIYDTRDFEPDPSKGIFLEYSHEYSAPWLGSQFNFHKFMFQGQMIHTVARWRNNKSRLTLAGLAAFGHIFGERINFIEMWDLSSQAEAGGILVLGGERSVRGFREARFLAPTVALVNLEARLKFYDFKFLKQHFSLGVTPFYDFGSVWDRPADIDFTQWRGAPGMGARIGWNQSTVVRLDYARSREGGQLFFGFGHIF